MDDGVSLLEDEDDAVRGGDMEERKKEGRKRQSVHSV